MVFRRRRPAVRRRKYGGRRRVVRRMYRPRAAPKVHKFKEMCPAAAGGWSAGTGVGSGVQTVALADLTNINSLKGMFDLYKITGYKVKLIPRFNQSEVTAPPNASVQAGNLPVLYLAPNRNGSVPAPTSIADILNDDGCKIVRLDRPTSMYVKAPKPLITFASGEQLPGQYGVSSKWQPWFSTGGNGSNDQTGLPHHGIRWLISNPGPLTVVIDCYVTLYFQMKEQD